MVELECVRDAWKQSRTDVIIVLNATCVSWRWTIIAHGWPIALVFTITNTFWTCFSTQVLPALWSFYQALLSYRQYSWETRVKEDCKLTPKWPISLSQPTFSHQFSVSLSQASSASTYGLSKTNTPLLNSAKRKAAMINSRTKVPTIWVSGATIKAFWVRMSSSGFSQQEESSTATVFSLKLEMIWNTNSITKIRIDLFSINNCQKCVWMFEIILC